MLIPSHNIDTKWGIDMKKKCLLTLLILTMLFSLTGCNAQDYKEAKQLYKDGDYAAGIEIFESLGTYMDSPKQVNEGYYQLALIAMTEEDYQTAIDLFTKLEDYKDSPDKLVEIQDILLARKLAGSWNAQYNGISALIDLIKSYGFELNIDTSNMTWNWPFVLELRQNGTGTFSLNLDQFSINFDAIKEKITNAIIDGKRGESSQSSGVVGQMLDKIAGLFGSDSFDSMVSNIVEGTITETLEPAYNDILNTIQSKFPDKEFTWSVKQGQLSIDGKEAAYNEEEDTISCTFFTSGLLENVELNFIR